ncbi:MAG: hypothetical protein N3A63_04640 [Bacteroidetes bacterium]|nr:hypothetical protein [Bacteroidota bacterium]
MKRTTTMIPPKIKKVIVLTLLLVTVLLPIKSSATHPRLHTTFRVALQPYGQWIVLPGEHIVWKPILVHRGWRPYTEGRWIWTHWGWYWESDEPFGWIVYHYGRWYFDPIHGWIWIPDTEWGPAWVEWRVYGDFIGWAPLQPTHSVVDVHHMVLIPSHSIWVFVRHNHFYNRFRSCDFNANEVQEIYEKSQSVERPFHKGLHNIHTSPFTPSYTLQETNKSIRHTKTQWRTFGVQQNINHFTNGTDDSQEEINESSPLEHSQMFAQQQRNRTERRPLRRIYHNHQEQSPNVTPGQPQAPRERRLELIERYERSRTIPPPGRRSLEERKHQEQHRTPERGRQR